MKDSRFCYFSISFIAWVLEREQTEVPKRRMEARGRVHISRDQSQ